MILTLCITLHYYVLHFYLKYSKLYLWPQDMITEEPHQSGHHQSSQPKPDISRVCLPLQVVLGKKQY